MGGTSDVPAVLAGLYASHLNDADAEFGEHLRLGSRTLVGASEIWPRRLGLALRLHADFPQSEEMAFFSL